MKARQTEEDQYVENKTLKTTPGTPVNVSVFKRIPIIVEAQYTVKQHGGLLICDICHFEMSRGQFCFDLALLFCGL